MAASHPLAGGGIGQCHPEEREAKNQKSDVEHGRSLKDRDGPGPCYEPKPRERSMPNWGPDYKQVVNKTLGARLRAWGSPSRQSAREHRSFMAR